MRDISGRDDVGKTRFLEAPLPLFGNENRSLETTQIVVQYRECHCLKKMCLSVKCLVTYALLYEITTKDIKYYTSLFGNHI